MYVKVRDPKWPKRHLYARGVVTEFRVYTGTRVPAPKWAEPGAVCIVDERGLHIIPAEWIAESSEHVDVPAIPETQRVYVITGSKGSNYTVTVDGNQRTCTCPGYGFRKDCKHIRQVSIEAV